jgi:hypothetical protein
MAKATDKLLKVNGELARQEKPIEVVIGDMVDPANFHMVFKSEVKGITSMEKILSEKVPGQNKGLKRLKVGKMVAIKREDDKLWFRARITDFYNIIDGNIEVEVFLLDHGCTLRGIEYPESVRELPSVFEKLEPFAFKFKLDGLVPITGRFKSSSPIVHAKNWSDIAATIAHISMKTCKQAVIRVQSRDFQGLPKSGKLLFELEPNKLGMYKRYVEFLEKGGYTSLVPTVDLNKAYIGSKFAVFVEPDAYQPKQVKPNFSAMIKHEKSKKPDEKSTDSGSEFLKPAVQRLSIGVRLMKLRSELDELMESDD